MRTELCLCFLAVVSVCAQQNATDPAQNYTMPEQDMPYPYPMPMPDPGLGMHVAAVQAEQQMSHLYGGLIVDVQSAMGWMQVAHGWLGLHSIEGRVAGFDRDFEEESAAKPSQPKDMLMEMEETFKKDLEEEEEEEHAETPAEKYTELERHTEMTLLYVLKFMYLQAGTKLSRAHQSHYETRMQLAVLQGMGAHQSAGGFLYMMYYVEALKGYSSLCTVTKQDAWNTWTMHELMETDEFGNGDSVPAEFKKTMALSRFHAMQQYSTEAMIDFQIMFMEYYLQTIMMQAMGGAPQGMGMGMAANHANSFIQEEMTEGAQPSKPFVPFLGHPQFPGMQTFYLKYFAMLMNMQAAQGFLTHASIELHQVMGDSSNGPADPSKMNKFSHQIKQFAIYAFQQWSYLYLIESMIDIYGIFTNSFMQVQGGPPSNFR